MEIVRGTLQFAQTSLSAYTPLTHTLTHYFLAGAEEAGEFLLRSHTETLPFSLSLSHSRSLSLSLSVATFIYVFQSRFNPPLQTPFPVEDHYLTSRYFIPPSLSLLLLHFHSYAMLAFFLLSCIDFCLSSHSLYRSLSPILPLGLYPDLVLDLCNPKINGSKLFSFHTRVIQYRS